MNVSIRRAGFDDAEALKQMFREAYAADTARIADLPDVAGGTAADIADRIVWVAADADALVGALVMSIDGPVAHLVNVAVAPSGRGTGLGRALIDKAVDAARLAGATRMDLATHVSMAGNVSLYEHLGWHVTCRTGNKVLMSRDI